MLAFVAFASKHRLRTKLHKSYEYFCRLCNEPTTDGKPFCLIHIMLMPYAKKSRRGERSEKICRARRNQKTCLRGHSFTPENTLIMINKEGRTKRRCRQCARQRFKKSYNKHKNTWKQNKINSGYKRKSRANRHKAN